MTQDHNLLIQIVLAAVPAFMLVIIGYMQWNTNQRILKSKVLDNYLNNYKKVTDAIGITIKKGYVTSDAYALFWQARDEARLVLSDEILEYTEKLFNLAGESYRTHLLLSPGNGEKSALLGKERKEKVEESTNILKMLFDEKPYDLYRKYTNI